MEHLLILRRQFCGVGGLYNIPMFTDNEPQKTPNRSEIYGLATLAGHAGTRRDLRIKAIRALARIPDQNAIHVLGEMALWEDDEEIRGEAYRSLEATFGDDMPEVLESIRQELTGQWAPDEDEDEAESEPAEQPEAWMAEKYAAIQQTPSVSQEEGTPLWLLWVVIGLAAMGGVVWLVFLR